MRLAFFFTRGVSLQLWFESGLLAREKLLFEEHLKSGYFDEIYWFTYGVKDAKLAHRLQSSKVLDSRIQVIPMPPLFQIPYFGTFLYSILLPVLRSRYLKHTMLAKSNQLDGSWTVIASSLLFGQHSVIRCGYVQSCLENSLKRLHPWRLMLLRLTESISLRLADIICVTSSQNAKYIELQYSVPSSRIVTIPNYVDCSRFCPRIDDSEKKFKNRLLFVGRFAPEKNISNLIHASKMAEMGLDLIGDGPLYRELESVAREAKADVQFLGRISNSNLCEVLQHYKFYVLPSLFEGMPKSLLEAMACALVCIGTNTTGINEVIQDGVNGFLSRGTDVHSIHDAIIRAKKIDSTPIQVAARRTVLTFFSLKSVVTKEQSVYSKLCLQHARNEAKRKENGADCEDFL